MSLKHCFSKRCLFAMLLAVAFLLRSTAGLAMQIDAMSMSNVPQSDLAIKAVTITADMPCHTTIEDSTLGEAVKFNHSTCGQCCVPAVLPSTAHFKAVHVAQTAPFTALFNNLPAPAQRPAKPPLV